MAEPGSPARVLIVGGGVAALEQDALAAQRADAVAEHVAARHGARLEPFPFAPVLRGLLFVGGPERYMRADQLLTAAAPVRG